MKQFSSGISLFLFYFIAVVIFTCCYFMAESPRQVAPVNNNGPALLQVADILIDVTRSFKSALISIVWYAVYMALLNIAYFILQFLAKNIDSFQLFSLSLFSIILSGLSFLLLLLLPGGIGLYCMFIPFVGVSFYLSRRAGVFSNPLAAAK